MVRRGGRWSRGKLANELSNFKRVREEGRLSGMGGYAPLLYSREVREEGGENDLDAVKEVRWGGKSTPE